MKISAPACSFSPIRLYPVETAMSGWSLASRVRQRYAGDELSPDGKVLMALGKAGQGGKAWTCSTADIGGDRIQRRCLRRRRPCTDFGNSLIVSCDLFRFARSLLCRPRRQQPRRHLRSGRPMSAAWKPFGRPSGIWIEKNDTLYATGSGSEDHRARTRTIPAANVAWVA